MFKIGFDPDKPVRDMRYRFFIAFADGREIEWRGLTLKQARDMYSYTDRHGPVDVMRFGWEETRK